MNIYKIYNKNAFNICNSHKNKNSDEKLLTRNYFCGTILIVERRRHKMIGLEYILDLYKISQSELASHLGIKKQNIHKWIKGIQDVSKKHIPAMSEFFGIPQEYFQKELTADDKIAIQSIKETGKSPEFTNVKDEKLNTLKVVINNYARGLVIITQEETPATPTTTVTSFAFTAFEINDKTITFKKDFSFDNVRISCNQIKEISYPDDLLEKDCKIELTLADNSIIKIILFDKKPELLIDTENYSKQYCEGLEFVSLLKDCKKVTIEYSQADIVRYISATERWNILCFDEDEEECECYEADNICITFFGNNDSNNPQFSLDYNVNDENITFEVLEHNEIFSAFRLGISESPYVDLKIKFFYQLLPPIFSN